MPAIQWLSSETAKTANRNLLANFRYMKMAAGWEKASKCSEFVSFFKRRDPLADQRIGSWPIWAWNPRFHAHSRARMIAALWVPRSEKVPAISEGKRPIA